jgi:hypothetical protein
MSDDPTQGMFDGLDDPHPSFAGTDRLVTVMARGRRLRRRRQATAVAGGTVAVVVVAVAAIGLSGGGGPADRGQQVSLASMSPTAVASGGGRSPGSVAIGPGQPSADPGVSGRHRRGHHPGRQVQPVATCVPPAPGGVSSQPPEPAPSASPSTVPSVAPTPPPTCASATPTPGPSGSTAPSGTASPPATATPAATTGP